MAASALDPPIRNCLTGSPLQALQDLANSSGKALTISRRERSSRGVREQRTSWSRPVCHCPRKRRSPLADAIPIIEKQGDDQMQAKKYTDAINTYEQGVRAAMLLARARKMETLGPEATPLMHKVNEAAKEAHTPDATSSSSMT